jgi:benzoyl-CoA-dihydrodiol lyase
VLTSARTANLLLRRQHLHAGRLDPRLEGELLQVHQRDPQRHGGFVRHSGLKFLAAVNGACAGGGYELALACDEICWSTTARPPSVLPEVPLLGVLPGTGGLTRVTDKRKVRRDLADIFCTSVEGVRGRPRAKEWRLVDAIAKPAQFAAKVQERARSSARPATARRRKGVALTPLERERSTPRAIATHVDVEIDRAARTATSPSRRPERAAADLAGIEARGRATGGRSRWRASSTTPSSCCAPTSSRSAPGCSRRAASAPRAGADARMLAKQGPLAGARDHRLSAPHVGAARRHLAQPVRADRRGLLLRRHAAELALAADRTYMLALPDDATRRGSHCCAMNFGDYPMVNGRARLARASTASASR